MKVLIIPEDFTHDQHILKPLFQAMMRELGKPHAKVTVCPDPRLGSVEQAMNWERIEEIIRRYGIVDLFLLCVDRDGKEGRQQALGALEQQAAAVLPENRLFLAINAYQEVETWLLAGQTDLPNNWEWRKIYDHPDCKDAYFLPYITDLGFLSELSQGRKILGKESAGRYNRVRQLCPEIAELEERVRTWLTKNG